VTAKRRISSPLDTLLVIDRLEVGPPRIESNRVTTPYRVVVGPGSSSIDYVYRFEDGVLEPDVSTDRNLAALMGAQVALNYGLFCREIVFRGSFDRADQSFLTEMTANTAREIYVKKFLEPNPFLTGEAANLPIVKQRSYLQARLSFPDSGPPDSELRSGAEAPVPPVWCEPSAGRRFAVLSSGGKDSLLSYGLLRELDFETHSIFVNESGRHWYTALNAYRFLSDSAADTTARVWTSSDRVFNWMLRHLPFVRPDFARLRSDEYPIRLWTVGIFLFGALAVARRVGISHLVIGDEFDTSRRVRHQGITHYDGLYDQSRFFDERLTRFYRRKRWPLVQFSVLRPLSELVIQKMLAERYPDLHTHQVSCHAAHLGGERALPCGKCEKCRRIVAMLVALGGDPTRCGYSKEQVAAAMEALGEKGVSQDAAGMRQLAWMLVQEGRVRPDTTFGAMARQHPEVLGLRFHDETSPVDAIPTFLRRPLYEIFIRHASSAFERHGRRWVEVDPLSEKFLSRPYRFELPSRHRGASATADIQAEAARSNYLLGELTWPLVKARLETTDTALLPVGAIEQHGPHLPLDTDTWDADYLSKEVARRCSDPRPLVLPPIAYGVSYHHADFPGTLSISPETLSRMVYEIGVSAARHGIVKLIIINGHGGNGPTLQYAAQMINRDTHIFTCVDSGDTSDADIATLTETPNDVHAGEVETSTSLATRPELVNMSLAKKAVPRFSNQYLDFSSRHSIEWYAHTGKLSKSGVLGDPTKATRKKGEKYWQVMIDHLVRFIEEIKGMSLAEIHERRQ
jgi:creatinine amidohydrolase/Fe(II)-dependent formamide hydrolase-like protein/7-cyano-7-deazaguanine synthase in queuosine biosynthesis